MATPAPEFENVTLFFRAASSASALPFRPAQPLGRHPGGAGATAPGQPEVSMPAAGIATAAERTRRVDASAAIG